MSVGAMRIPARATGPMPAVVWASVIVNLVIAVGSAALAWSVFGIETAGNDDSALIQQLVRLGRPVILAAALIALLPAIIALISTAGLLRRRINGRGLALVLQYLGVVLCAVALLHLWGFFDSFEAVVDGIMAAPWVLLGFPLAYALYWVSGRVRGPLAKTLENAAGLAAATAVLLALVVPNFGGLLSAITGAYAEPTAWIATAAMIGFGVLAWNLLKTGAYFGETQDEVAAWQGWLMLSPNIIGFTLFFAGPLLLSLYLSFTDSTVGQVPNITGFDNYADILALEVQPLANPDAALQSALTFGFSPLGAFNLFGTTYVLGAQDALFWVSLRNTLAYCLLLIPLSVLPALGLALVLNSKLPGVKIFRAIYFLPSVAAVVGTALIWRWLYDPTIGFINYAIAGLTGFLGLPDPEVAWLTGPATVLISMVVLSAWQVIGFNTVLFLAGLQGIPVELNEAAAIDGANRWNTLIYITIPMLAPTTFFVMITTIITGLQVFNEPYALFPSVPIPENATTSVYYLYNQGFFRFNFGYASAIAWVVFALIFTITLIQFRLQRNSSAYAN